LAGEAEKSQFQASLATKCDPPSKKKIQKIRKEGNNYLDYFLGCEKNRNPTICVVVKIDFCMCAKTNVDNHYLGDICVYLVVFK
jgi:hypothetical protein